MSNLEIEPPAGRPETGKSPPSDFITPAGGSVSTLNPSYGKNDLRTPRQILASWRAQIEDERLSEKSCLKHRMPDQSKWHEGKADALERCADELEFLILARNQIVPISGPSGGTPL